MTKKLDHLGLCNDQGVPLEDFRLAFCMRCFQEECTRSQHGLSKFDVRVNSWEQRLFNAPSLPKTDPRFPIIAAKKFLALPVGPTQAVREWIDLVTLDVPSPPAQVPQVSPPSVAVSQAQAPALPEKKVEPEVPVVVEKVDEPPAPPAPRQNLLVNTPYTGPRTLANQPENKDPQKDAWAAPPPPRTGENVIRPGARVKIGGGS